MSDIYKAVYDVAYNSMAACFGWFCSDKLTQHPLAWVNLSLDKQR